MTDKNKKKADLGSMEITSPRTAGKTGPQQLPQGENCCSTSEHSMQEAHGHPVHYVPTVFSLLLLVGGIVLDYFQIPWFTGYLRFITYLIAYLPVGGKVLAQAARNIARGDVFNEFFLMGIATLGAFYIGEYAEGVAVMLFYVVGEHFQESAVQRSRLSIKSLIDNRPDTVNVFRQGILRKVHPSSVELEETIQVKAGEKISLDGEMLSKNSFFNTDALTGEAQPKNIRKGEKVFAGMVNMDKVVEIKVTSVFENSTLSKILLLVEQASGRKAKTQQFITRFAKVYTPVVVFLATSLVVAPYFILNDYNFDQWLYRALVFLVISCPCALVISIPLGYFGGIGAASKNGILFKGSNFLDLMTKVDTVVLDKTGTLTQGVFKVQQVKIAEMIRMEPATFLSLTAALENQSNHPIAKALIEYEGGNYKKWKVSEAEEISGHGLKGTVEGLDMLVGNVRLLKKFNIPYPPELDNEIDTLVAVGINGEYAGHITIADVIKEGTVEAIKALRQLDIQEIIMLSGDKPSITGSIAKKLSIDQAFGGLLPQDKVAKVEELTREGKTVAFVGDGINDAPVLTRADVGIAMGGLGSDAAIETADVVIQNDQLSKIATAIHIGRQTKQGVWQNIGMAFGVKAIVLVLGAFGVASLWEAVFADVGVALLAIFNAMRTQRMKFK
jgi:Cd2+/Zn2+-exporting ATPase